MQAENYLHTFQAIVKPSAGEVTLYYNYWDIHYILNKRTGIFDPPDGFDRSHSVPEVQQDILSRMVTKVQAVEPVDITGERFVNGRHQEELRIIIDAHDFPHAVPVVDNTILLDESYVTVTAIEAYGDGYLELSYDIDKPVVKAAR